MFDVRLAVASAEVEKLANICRENTHIDPVLYGRYEVKRGLRDVNGRGVLTGLTEISEISSQIVQDGELKPCEGRLYYRGINIKKLVKGFLSDKRLGYEEIAYLLLFGEQPNIEALEGFHKLLAEYQALPPTFVRDIIMKSPSNDMMNMLARSVLTLYAYDEKADDISPENVLRQCLQLIALFPQLAIYGYQAFSHYFDGNSLIIHSPKPEYSVAENILHMLRPDSSFTKLEAMLLDAALVLQMEHGGGNNSTFTTHVVTSTGTDTYSVIAAALGSLKGPRHGGANIKVAQMFEDMKQEVKDWHDDEEIEHYLSLLLEKKAFDHSGLIYGMGHAVYSLSDPRADILRDCVKRLSEEKGLEDEFALYAAVERIAPKLIAKKRRMYKGVSANVDFYSGFVYDVLNLPKELYTPMFAVARIVGWSAHRLEEILNAGKIIRPAYKSISKHRPYIPLNER